MRLTRLRKLEIRSVVGGLELRGPMLEEMSLSPDMKCN